MNRWTCHIDCPSVALLFLLSHTQHATRLAADRGSRGAGKQPAEAAAAGNKTTAGPSCRPQLRTRMPSGKPGKFSTSWVVVSWPPATRWKEGRKVPAGGELADRLHGVQAVTADGRRRGAVQHQERVQRAVAANVPCIESLQHPLHGSACSASTNHQLAHLRQCRLPSTPPASPAAAPHAPHRWRLCGRQGRSR